MKKRKGLSTIVATLIIILLVLVATGIIWVVVRNVIQEGAEQVSLGKFTLDLELKQVQRIGETDSMSVQVKRNAGAGEFVALNFIFDDGDNAVIVKQNVSLKELEQKTYTMEVLGINLSNLRKVSIAPVFRLESGKEVVGDVKDFVEFGSGVSVGSGDSNVGADCTVENVASDCGESETVRICYNGDVQDRTSSWSCVDESCEVSYSYNSITDCSGSTPYCLPSTVSCVECLTSSNCDSGFSCENNVCETQSNPTNEFLANGFENSGSLALPYTGMKDNLGSIAISTDSYEGVYSLKLTSSDSSYHYTSPDEGPSAPVVSLSGGGDVTYSVYAKGDGVAQAGLMILCLDSEDIYWNENAYSENVEQAVGSSWTKLTVSYTCPPSTENVAVRLSVRGAGSVWFDNAELSTEEIVCTPNSYTACDSPSGDVYNYDSCDNRGSLVDDCSPDEICSNGQCIAQSGNCVSYDGACGSGCTTQQDADCLVQIHPDWPVFTLKDENDYANRVYIDPTYSGTETGSQIQPYNSWSDISSFQSNTAYVQKRGTSTTVNKELIVSQDNVYFGGYGTGARPKIVGSYGNLFEVRSSNVLFRGMHMENPAASSANSGTVIYFPKDYGAENGVVYDSLINNSGWEGILSYHPGLKILHSEISHIDQDGFWFGRPNLEFAYNDVHDVNEAYYVYGGDQNMAGGDALQGAYSGNEFWIHDNSFDRHNTGNKFNLILSAESNPGLWGIIERNSFYGPKPGGHGGTALYIIDFNKNLEIKNNNFYGDAGRALWIESVADVVFSENSFNDYDSGLDDSLIYVTGSSNVRFLDNSFDNIVLPNGPVIAVSSSSGVQINGNDFSNINGDCFSGSYTASGNTGDCLS